MKQNNSTELSGESFHKICNKNDPDFGNGCNRSGARNCHLASLVPPFWDPRERCWRLGAPWKAKGAAEETLWGLELDFRWFGVDFGTPFEELLQFLGAKLVFFYACVQVLFTIFCLNLVAKTLKNKHGMTSSCPLLKAWLMKDILIKDFFMQDWCWLKQACKSLSLIAVLVTLKLK